jgi:hypothetical protein
MVVMKLLSHGWKQSMRSASRGQNTAGNVIVIVIGVLLAVNLLGLGLFLHALLKQVEPGLDPVLVFNGWVVFYLGVDLLLRQMFQRIPGQSIVPYLTLRLRRSVLVHLLLLRSFVSFFNFLPWMIVLPFAANAVIPAYGIAATVAWVACLGLLMGSNSLFNLLLKKLSINTFRFALALGMAVIGVFVLDALDILPLASLSRGLLGAVLEMPLFVLVVVFVPAIVYGITFSVLRHRMYLEDLHPATTVRTDSSSRYRFLESAGVRGRYVALELKLFFRNRRARASLLVGLFVLPLGIFFYGMILRALGDAYPVPSDAAIESARASEEFTTAPPGFHRVTFQVDTGIVPDIAQVYVTGDHPILRNWKPSAVPLLRNPDSSWSKTIVVEEGTTLRYCFTLGSWQTEEKIGDGSEPPIYNMTVVSDTTIARAAIVWKTPELPLMVEVNLVYFGLMLTGMMMFVYGQFFLAWDSTFFDALLTWRIRFRSLLRTKVMILFVAAVISFVLTLPYAFMDTRILLINSLAFLYNIGVNSYVMLFLATRSKKRFELNEGIFSQQGKGAAQFVAILPMWILPVVVFAVLDGVGVPYALYLFFGLTGLVGLLLQRPMLRAAFRMLETKRYEIAAGFRQGGTT